MTSMTTKIGLILIILLSLVAVFAPWIAPYDPAAFDLPNAFAGPSVLHWLGQDADGRDILSRIIFGTRTSLGIGVVVTAISLIVGSGLGLFVAMQGKWWDRIFLFVSDVFMAFPSFLFAIAIAAFLSPSVANVILILALKGWVSYARLIRGQALSLREREFVAAAKSIGASDTRIGLKYLFPNMLGTIAVNTSFGMAGVIIIESSLSFLGLGVPPGTPSWGGMLDEGVQYLLVTPTLSIFPGIFLMHMVLAFNFVGDGLRDRWAPRGR
ncbi:MAG: ABC transporter permease [Deltaproteobacteria bacterium]|nr:ABC transporter permease [Deltaproteobacteria bacterium]